MSAALKAVAAVMLAAFMPHGLAAAPPTNVTWTNSVEQTADNEITSVQGGIKYNLTGASEVNLYDMTGHRVLGTTVSGSGIIPTVQLPAGIYVYSVEGTSRRTGKLFVR